MTSPSASVRPVPIGRSLALFSAMLFLGSDVVHAGLAWQQVTANAPWASRTEFNGIVHNGRMWVIGGANGSYGTWPARNDVWSSTDGLNWSQSTSAAPWEGRRGAAAASYSGRMWIMGGSTGSLPNGARDVWSSTNGSSWALVTSTPAWSSRWQCPGLSFNGSLWILSGNIGGNTDNQVWSTTDGSSWTLATSSPGWPGRTGMPVLDFNSRMWYVENLGEVWSSANGSSWTQATANAPWPDRYSFPGAVSDGRMWILGGGGNKNDVWSSTDGATWSQDTANASWAGRQEHIGLAFNNTLWVMGGTVSGVSNDVWYAAPCVPPTVTGDPSPVTITNCSPAVFTVSVAGSDPLYQWRQEGTNLSDDGRISGANSATLTINPVGSSDQGNYDVVVTNGCGNDTSAMALLTLVFGGRSDCDTNGIPDECEGGGENLWQGLDGAFFVDSFNWSLGTTPDPIQVATLRNNGAMENRCILDEGQSAQVCGLLVEATGNGKQILAIRDGAIFRADQGSTVASGGEIQLSDGELAGSTVDNLTNTITGYGTISADVYNEGLISVSSTKDMDLTGAGFDNQSGGLLRADSGSRVWIQAAGPNQEGELEARPQGLLSFQSNLLNGEGASILLLAGTVATPLLTNAAGATVTGTGSLDAQVENNGDFVLIADLLVAGDMQNDGTITIQSGLLTVAGNLTGSGAIIGGFGGRDGGPSGIQIFGNFDVSGDLHREWEMLESCIWMAGGQSGVLQSLEAPAADCGGRGVTLPVASSFSFHTLHLGLDSRVQLVDRHLNSADAGFQQRQNECVRVRRLVLEPSARLDLNGLRLYCEDVSMIHSGRTSETGQILDSLGGGAIVILGADESD